MESRSNPIVSGSLFFSLPKFNQMSLPSHFSTFTYLFLIFVCIFQDFFLSLHRPRNLGARQWFTNYLKN